MWFVRFLWLLHPDVKVGGRQHNLFVFTTWLHELCTYVNSCFHFFVYYVMGSRFRVTLWELLRRKAKTSTSEQTAVTSTTQQVMSEN